MTAALEDLDGVRAEESSSLTDLDLATLLAMSSECRIARGDLDAAEELDGLLGPLLDAPGLPGATAHQARGELAVVLGDIERAAAAFARAARLLADETDRLAPMVPWRASAALVAVRRGRSAEAAGLAEEHLALARADGSAYDVALGLRTLATVGAHARRTSRLREARAVLTDVPAARLAAQVDTDLAGLLLLSSTPEAGAEALPLLRSAEEYAGRERLRPLRSRVRRLLDRMGEPGHPVVADAVAALTAAETRVAALAAAGLTNREIAQRLTVGVKAVEWHLSGAYRKLGIRSRSLLPRQLGTVTTP